MHTTPDTLALIGNTPLVRLAGPSDATGCDIFGKCEFANPGASVKDRAALFIVEDAEARGALKPGGTHDAAHRRRQLQVRHDRLQALAVGGPGDHIDARIFGKPVTRPYRRMGVALARAGSGSTDDARRLALAAADAIYIDYSE